MTIFMIHYHIQYYYLYIYIEQYQASFGKRNNMRFKLAFSIKKKRVALIKIITTINEFRGDHRVNTI